MIKTSKEIHEIVRQYCLYCFVADGNYYLPTLEEIKTLIKKSFIEKYKYKIETFDCDDFALILHAWIRQKQYRDKWENPWAFGEVWGKFKKNEFHAMNFVITRDKGFLLIEPQTDEVKSYETTDTCVLIRM
jgi:hypothetical protein